MLKNQQHFITIDKSYESSKKDSIKSLLVALVLMDSIFSISLVLPSLIMLKALLLRPLQAVVVIVMAI